MIRLDAAGFAGLQTGRFPSPSAVFVIGARGKLGLRCPRKQRSEQMKTILIALAALGLTASAALAECAYHTTQNTTASDEEKPTATQ